MPGGDGLRRESGQVSRRWVRRALVATTLAAVGMAILGVGGALPVGSYYRLAPAEPELGPAVDKQLGRPGTPTRAAAGTPAATSSATVAPAAPVPTNAKKPASAPLPGGSGSGKRVVHDISAQQVWLVGADDAVVRTYLVSGSKYDQLDPGTYRVFSTSRHATSWHGTESMEYMVRFHRGARSNIGFHDIPVDTSTGAEVQTVADLGVPLSDGCIRQDVVDAQALWEFAPVGTPVVVLR